MSTAFRWWLFGRMSWNVILSFVYSFLILLFAVFYVPELIQCIFFFVGHTAQMQRHTGNRILPSSFININEHYQSVSFVLLLLLYFQLVSFFLPTFLFFSQFSILIKYTHWKRAHLKLVDKKLIYLFIEKANQLRMSSKYKYIFKQYLRRVSSLHKEVVR